MRTSFRYSNDEAVHYDRLVENEIPSYREIHRLIVEWFPYDDSLQTFHYLELGVGTGNLTSSILEGHPNIEVDAYDISEVMLRQARKKLSRFSNVIRFHNNDVFHTQFVRRYNAITLFLCEPAENAAIPAFFEQLANCLWDGASLLVCVQLDGVLADSIPRRITTTVWKHMLNKARFQIFDKFLVIEIRQGGSDSNQCKIPHEVFCHLGQRQRQATL